MKSLVEINKLPDISFYPNGRIDITARLAKMLNLQCGDVIDISREGGEYYLHKRFQDFKPIGRHAACCYATHRYKNTCNNLRVYYKPLTDHILALVGADVARLAVGEPVNVNGILAVPIIYKRNINVTRHD